MHAADLLLETLRLRPRLDPEMLAREWPGVRPAGLLAMVEYEKGAMWLLRRLRETGADQTAPPAIVDPLRQGVRRSTAGNMLVDGEAASVVRRLDALGIPHVLLKGVAMHAAAHSRLPYGDARPTSDVDLLLPAADVSRAWEDLRRAGYVQAFPASPHHAPPLIGAGRVAVELHSSMAAALAADTAWRRANDGAVELEWNGVRVRIPSPTELLWHSVSHALLDGGKAWRLRYFLDGAAAMAADAPIAWDVIGRRLDDGEVSEHAKPRRWLATASELAGTSLPSAVAKGAPPLNLSRIFRWRLGVLARRADRGLGGRLLEEGARIEVGLGLGGAFQPTPAWKTTRRRLAGLAARMIYRTWRTWN